MFSPWQKQPEWQKQPTWQKQPEWQPQPAWQKPPAWPAQPWPAAPVPTGRPPLLETATGALPVPQSLPPERLPPAVRAAISRVLDAPPKPAVTLGVMNETQASMIAPDLPFRSNV
jgi:hypothetical protein